MELTQEQQLERARLRAASLFYTVFSSEQGAEVLQLIRALSGHGAGYVILEQLDPGPVCPTKLALKTGERQLYERIALQVEEGRRLQNARIGRDPEPGDPEQAG